MNLFNRGGGIVLITLIIALAMAEITTAESDLEVNIESPADVISSEGVDFLFTTNFNSNCSIETESFNETTGENTTDHEIYLEPFSEGEHEFDVSCSYVDNVTKNYSMKSSFVIDTNPPKILSHHPEEVNEESIQLRVETDEESTCRYSKERDKSFLDMGNMFDITGDDRHKTSLTFEEDGIYDYFVRCEDDVGNINQNDYRARISVDKPPTARIALDGTSPVSSGTHKVTVITSEALISSPKLRYTLQDEDGREERFNVPLSGEGQEWEGFMIISDSGNRKVGSFNFEGVDYGGNSGTKITSGGTFIIDSTSPGKIDDLEAVPQEDGSMKLNWEDDNEQDIERYEIYRSTSSGVTKLDYYDYTKNKVYMDKNVDSNTRYHYRIRGVDEAGNQGELSREVDARTGTIETEEDSQESEETVQETNEERGLSSNLMPILEESINEYRGLKKLVDDMLLHYRGKSDIDEEILEDLDIINQVSKAKSEIFRHIDELESLEDRDLEEEELKEEIRSIEIRLESAKSDIPTSIKEIDTVDLEEKTSMQDTINGFDGLMSLFRIQNMNEDIKEEYIEESFSLSSYFAITGTAEILEIEYHDGSSSEMLLVREEIEYVGDSRVDEEGLMVVLDIDESVASNVDDISFLSEEPETLKKSTMVKWDLSELNGEIKYYIEGDIDDFSEEEISTIIMDDYSLYFDELGREVKEDKGGEDGMLTGRAILDIPGDADLGNIIMMGFGILVVAGLTLYYFTMDSKPSGSEEKEEPPKDNTTKKINNKKGNLVGKKFKDIYKEMRDSGELEVNNLELEIPELEDYSKKIEKATNLIDNLDFKESSKLYIKILEDMKNEEDDNIKSNNLNNLKKLYSKLTLYQNIIYFHQTLRKDDYRTMYEHVKNITESHNTLISAGEPDNELMELARASHKEYLEYLNNKNYMPEY